jgi:hypothetical protein
VTHPCCQTAANHFVSCLPFCQTILGVGFCQLRIFCIPQLVDSSIDAIIFLICSPACLLVHCLLARSLARLLPCLPACVPATGAPLVLCHQSARWSDASRCQFAASPSHAIRARTSTFSLINSLVNLVVTFLFLQSVQLLMSGVCIIAASPRLDRVLLPVHKMLAAHGSCQPLWNGWARLVSRCHWHCYFVGPSF